MNSLLNRLSALTGALDHTEEMLRTSKRLGFDRSGSYYADLETTQKMLSHQVAATEQLLAEQTKL